ncbi:MAG: MFS transporter [Kiloniellales bacterium]|nr:MFS transporter [Kiloniellales bacterium]
MLAALGDGRERRVYSVLLVNTFGFNLGFYMMLPYLAAYLSGDLGYSAVFVGLLLGLRNLSQQGLFLVGGTLADRFDHRQVILAGCLLRVLGFALFGLVISEAGLILATVLSGFAGALFTPASQAYMAAASQGHARRNELYALQSMAAEAGALLGPLFGLALLFWDFRLICYAAAGVFLALAIVQARFLPSQPGSERKTEIPIGHDLLLPLKNRSFVLFTLFLTAYYVFFMQLYLMIPLAIPEDWRDIGTGLVFFLSAVLGVGLQLPIHRLCRAVLTRPQAIALGLLVMGFAFGLLAWTPAWAGAYAPLVGPVTAAAVLTLGTLMAFPYVTALVPELAGERRQGTYYGWFYFAAGFGGMLGSGAVGWLWELGLEPGLWLLPGLAVLSAAGVLLTLSYRRPVDPEDSPIS